MVNLYTDSAFQKAIEAAEQLSIDERLMLLDVLRQRMQQAQRQEIVAEVATVRQEYNEGNVKFGSVQDFMSELDEI
jgi:hypothetical protein